MWIGRATPLTILMVVVGPELANASLHPVVPNHTTATITTRRPTTRPTTKRPIIHGPVTSRPLTTDFIRTPFMTTLFTRPHFTSLTVTPDPGSVLEDCGPAYECCVLYDFPSQQLKCCKRHGCCAPCRTVPKGCYFNNHYKWGDVVLSFPHICVDFICGAKLSNSTPHVEAAIIPIMSRPTNSGQSCGIPMNKNCIWRGIVRDEGDEWSEASCQLCSCHNGEVTCKTLAIACPPPPKAPCRREETDQCCPIWNCLVIGMCYDNGKLHRIGERWNDPNDPCVEFECTRSGKIGTRKQCVLRHKPGQHCRQGKDSDGCCDIWHCGGCTDYKGEPRKVGDKWTDPRSPCETSLCTLRGVVTTKRCLPLPLQPNKWCRETKDFCGCNKWRCFWCTDNQGRHRAIGSTWQDPGNTCETYECLDTGEIKNTSTPCPPPGNKPNSWCKAVTDHCGCQTWDCKCTDHEGVHHALGDTWNIGCMTFVCMEHGRIQSSRRPCGKLGSRPDPWCRREYDDCGCVKWNCSIPGGCEDDQGQHHKEGDMWDNDCETFLCTTRGHIVSRRKPCPPLTSVIPATCNIVRDHCGCQKLNCSVVDGCPLPENTTHMCDSNYFCNEQSKCHKGFLCCGIGSCDKPGNRCLKPGTCPPVLVKTLCTNVFRNFNICSEDYQCRGSQKCCREPRDPCKLKCMDPWHPYK